MIGGRLLARNTALNLLGQVAPAAAAVIAIPLLIHGMGTARFGVLTLAWTAIGYFGLFDLGLGRALTHAVATRLGEEGTEAGDLAEVTWTALVLMLVLGLLAAVLVAALTPWLAGRVLNIPPSLREESAVAFYLLALSLPVTIMTSGLRGMLEAHQDFGVATALRVPLGVFSFVGPLFVLPFSHALGPSVAALVFGRYVGWGLHLVVCMRRYPYLGRGIVVRRAQVLPLVRFGGWMTVSNVISPLMVTTDRFLVGALLPVAAVAYYVTSYEVATKLWIIPGALMGVLFPAFAAAFASNRARTSALVERAVRLVIAVIFPLSLLLVGLGREGLTLWLGAAFARESTSVLQWLAVGVLVNCVGQVAFTALQGIGRPDLTAKLHLAELPLYAASIWLLVHALGLVGVAMAWVLRVTLDTLVLLVLTGRYLPEARAALGASLRIVVLLVAVEAMTAMLRGTGSRLILLAIVLPAFAALAWFRLLQSSERNGVRSWLRGFKRSPAGLS